MAEVKAAASSEEEFAVLVDALAADVMERRPLIDLLREDHPCYDQRGATTVARMRGWVLLSLARTGISDESLQFVLEELDTGVDPYLVAAAAAALRSYPTPTPALAPFVMRALSRIRYRDDPVSLQAYGDYDVSSTSTSPVRELLKSLAWLGAHAIAVLPEIEAVTTSGRLSKQAKLEADRTLEALRQIDRDGEKSEACCALPGGLLRGRSWSGESRRRSEPVESTVLEDQHGSQIAFRDLVVGHPSIVVFFYTRCDNPLKCSLTIAKLARVQKLLESRGLADRIHTAAITYDPAFDLADRLRRYGENRGVRMDACHRLLRAPDGMDALRRHFRLGVNFVESLVNRHRVEAYILDAQGRIAASFERLLWDEQALVDRAIEVLSEGTLETAPGDPPSRESTDPDRPERRRTAAPAVAAFASLGVAFFPKCPMCWATYASVFGIAGVTQIPYSPWLQPMLAVVMLINVISVWLRGWSTGRLTGAWLVSAGALLIIAAKLGFVVDAAVAWGVALTFAGSLLSAVASVKTPRSPQNPPALPGPELTSTRRVLPEPGRVR